MTARLLAGGGSLDGHLIDIPAWATTVTTTPGRHHYELDDSGTLAYAGAGRTGEIMSEYIRDDRQAADAERAAVEAFMRPRSCSRCGFTFATQAEHQVAHDPHWPGGCVPPEVAGLVEVDGVWCQVGSAGR